MRSKYILIPILATVLVLTHACKGQEVFSDPPLDLQESDLVGTWEAHYDGPGTGVDRLVLKADGTFQQTYDSFSGHTFETSWNQWTIERFPGETRIYVYFEGARFYDQGIRMAEKEGIMCTASQCLMDTPYMFIDPVDDNHFEMVGRLILSVRSSPEVAGGLVLKHMLIGGDNFRSGTFFLVEEP